MDVSRGGRPEWTEHYPPRVRGEAKRRPTMRLNIWAFGFACAFVWGIGLFCLTWWIIAFEGATNEITFLGHLYRGYNISPAGSVIGLLWAFADGLIGGLVFAWLYNALATRLPGARERERS